MGSWALHEVYYPPEFGWMCPGARHGVKLGNSFSFSHWSLVLHCLEASQSQSPDCLASPACLLTLSLSSASYSHALIRPPCSSQLFSPLNPLSLLLNPSLPSFPVVPSTNLQLYFMLLVCVCVWVCLLLIVTHSLFLNWNKADNSEVNQGPFLFFVY